MKRITTIQRLLRISSRVLAVGMMAGLAHASTNMFNFDSDPSSLFSFVSRSGDNATLQSMAGVWFSTNGSTLEAVADQSTNGYFAITQTTPNGVSGAHGMRSSIVFNDFDNGLIMAGFTFSCDLRIGAGSSQPADGFSLNYARAGDPAITGGAFGNSPANVVVNGPEEGTTTGLALSFDCYNNGSGDIIGLTIKVDNVVITNCAMPTLNGACTDITSLQTGTNDAGLAGLCWQPLWVNLDPTNGLLNVNYKNQVLLTNYPVLFAASPGRLIFAGRTGGLWQEQDVDNIQIVTVPSPWPLVGPVTGKANGWRFAINDSGFATPDVSSITVTFDGTPVTPTAIVQTGNIGAGDGTGSTIVSYESPSLLLASGSRHTNHVHFTGSDFTAVDKDVAFTIPAYTVISVAQKAPGAVNASLTDGFLGRIHQLPIARYPDPLSFNGMEQQLADGYIDPGTSLPYVSVDPVSSFTNVWLNWTVDAPAGGRAGFFNSGAGPDYITDDAVPGIDWVNDLSTTNIAAEMMTALYLPVGAYQLGVTHDDGVKISIGAEPRDVFASTVLASQTSTAEIGPVNIVVTNSGYYPIRLLWGQAGAAGHLELFSYDWATGQRMLVNDRSKPTAIIAYADPGAFTLPYVRWVSPAPGETGIAPNATIKVKLEDGTGATITSAKLTCNAGLATGSKSGTTTSATLNPGQLASGVRTATLIYTTSAGASVTNSWTFSVAPITLDKTHSYPGYGQNSAVFTPSGGGHSGLAGDFAIDLGTAGTANITVTNTAFLAALNTANAGDVATWSIWLKRKSSGTGGDIQNSTLYWAQSTTATANRGWNLHCPWSDNRVYFDTGGTDNTLNRINALITTFPPYAAVNSTGWWTNWHHVVAIKNGTQKQVFFDGQLFLSGNNTQPLTTDWTALYLGSQPSGTGTRGWIDDFAVYSTALSTNDITALYTGTAPDAITASSSLLGYWPFNDALAAPVIRLALSGGTATITYTGTLQSSSTVNGTYADVIGASSPLTTPAGGQQMFYRARQ